MRGGEGGGSTCRLSVKLSLLSRCRLMSVNDYQNKLIIHIRYLIHTISYTGIKRLHLSSIHPLMAMEPHQENHQSFYDEFVLTPMTMTSPMTLALYILWVRR